MNRFIKQQLRHLALLGALASLLLVSGCHQDASAEDHEGHDHSREEEEDDHEGADDHGDAGVREVVLSEIARRRAGIEVETVSARALTNNLRVIAEVELAPNRVAHISPLLSGQLTKVSGEIGARVKKGDKLAELSSVEVSEASARLASATASVKLARETLKRQQKLRDERITSERELQEARRELELARAREREARARAAIYNSTSGRGAATLSSPIDGTIIERHATMGEVVDPEDVLFQIADTSQVWIVGRVFEKDASKVLEGMPAVLTLHAYPGKSWTGKVAYVDRVLDHRTHSVAVRMELDNPERLLKPGYFGALHLDTGGDSKPRPVVPVDALQRMDNRTVLLVPGDKPRSYRMREVITGVEQDGFVEILEGIEVGEQVVVQGAFVLKSHLMRSELGHGHAH
jgi:cobalt-zinc-cadmium efflux system membrane fusion protein